MPTETLLEFLTALIARALAVGLLIGLGHRTISTMQRRHAWLLCVGAAAGLAMAEGAWPLGRDDLYVVWVALCIAVGGIVPTYVAASVVDRNAVLVRDDVAWMIDDTPAVTRTSRALLGYLAAGVPAALLLRYALRPLLIR